MIKPSHNVSSFQKLGTSAGALYKPPCVRRRVQEAMEVIDSGNCSRVYRHGETFFLWLTINVTTTNNTTD